MIFRLASVFVVVCVGCSGAELPPGKPQPRAALSDCDPCSIHITGSDKRWHVQYEGADGSPLFAGKGLPLSDIHVPQDADVEFVLHSTDYLYILSVREQGVKQIALPDLEFRVTFHPASAGMFELAGDEMCGEPHPDLQGHLIVEPREQLMQWLSERIAEASD
jgi:heme/copper-type cytochrome/quinol oxidase subunit 2